MEVTLTFDDRPYRLGGLIPVTVDLQARREVSVRGGWVDLLCHEEWTASYVMDAPTSSRPMIVGGGGLPATVMPTPTAPRRVSEEKKQTYVHSRVVFLEGLQLPEGSNVTYNARLQIEPDPPDHIAVSTVTWRLAMSIDLPRTLDVHLNCPIVLDLERERS